MQLDGPAEQQRLQGVAFQLHHRDNDAEHDQGGYESVGDQPPVLSSRHPQRRYVDP
jgi:hypothetical protein